MRSLEKRPEVLNFSGKSTESLVGIDAGNGRLALRVNPILKGFCQNNLLLALKIATMANGHFEKWIFKTIVGLVLIAGGFFFMYYTLVHFYEENWVLHAVISSVAVAAGVYFLSSASINKMKSDLIKKQKIRQQSG